MTRVVGAVILTCLVAASAWADVTVKTAVKGPMGSTESVQYIKGTKMRQESNVMGRQNILIVDAAARQMIALDPATKTATVTDLSKMAEQIQKSAQPSDVKVSMTPTGQTKQILGRTCTEYTLTVSFSITPPNMPQGQGQAMTMTMGGPACIVKDAPGTKDFQSFYKAASESGLFVGAGGGRGRGGMGGDRGLAAMYNAYADAGGMPYEQVIEMKGTGPMANMMQGATTTMTVTSVSTDPIPADLFEIPAGYTKRTQ